MIALLRDAYTRWAEDRAPRLAAALAYYSVFSFAPILLVAAGLAALLFGEPDLRVKLLESVAAILGRRGAEALGGMMSGTKWSTQSGIISTVGGVAAFVVAAVAVVAQLKDALNAVWDVKTSERVSWSDTVKVYLMNIGIVVAAGFLLLVSLVATTALSAFTFSSRRWLGGPPALWFGVDFAFGLAFAAVVFALIFRVIPDAPVRWRDAWAGGVFTAALFTMGRLALGVYLGRESSESVYDAAGSVVALLVWVYYSAQIVLFGAEFTFVYANRKTASSRR